MSGVKQFKTRDVLDRAMTVFWRHGYQATSIQDLIEATGINRGSLYATFGDKQRLFLAVLDHYMERMGKLMLDELADPNPRRAIERLFAALVRRNCDPAWPRGCLATNTALECPDAGDEINRKIAANLGQIESAIYRVLRRAQADGSLDPNQDARSLARFFLGVAQGLNVVNKAFADPAILQDIVENSMSIWKAPRANVIERTARSGPAV
jgi:TetR/AcrR family transcriptional regulator, transcriptional repressor for nem operon